MREDVGENRDHEEAEEHARVAPDVLLPSKKPTQTRTNTHTHMYAHREWVEGQRKGVEEQRGASGDGGLRCQRHHTRIARREAHI